MDDQPALLPDTTQPELPGMETMCADVGLDNVPSGLAKLSHKQRAFTLELLRTGNASEAARAAGYSNPHSDGAKVKRHPEVAAVLAQAMAPVARNVDQLIRRVSERSRIAHTMVQREMDKPETTRSHQSLRAWMDAANKADALLGTLLGKIQGVHVTGKVEHTHAHNHTGVVAMPAEALPFLAQVRRSVVEERMQATVGGNN